MRNTFFFVDLPLSHPYFDIAVSCTCERGRSCAPKMRNQEACPRSHTQHFDCCFGFSRSSHACRAAVVRDLRNVAHCPSNSLRHKQLKCTSNVGRRSRTVRDAHASMMSEHRARMVRRGGHLVRRSRAMRSPSTPLATGNHPRCACWGPECGSSRSALDAGPLPPAHAEFWLPSCSQRAVTARVSGESGGGER